MRTRIKLYGWTLVVLGIIVGLIPGIGLPQKLAVPEAANAISKLPVPSRGRRKEEAMIRLAYKKFELYNFVSLFEDTNRLPTADRIEGTLTFDLSEFKSGTIGELKPVLYAEAVTPPSEEMLEVIQYSSIHNNSEERLAYRVRWIPGLFSSLADRRSTVEDVLKVGAERYYNVTGYTRYRVRASFQGKSRSYSAVALHRANEELVPDFWDSIAGLGGTVTDTWKEETLPLKISQKAGDEKARNMFKQRVENAVVANRADTATERPVKCKRDWVQLQQCRISSDLVEFWAVDDENHWERESGQPGSSESSEKEDVVASNFNFYAFDETGHIPRSGMHAAGAVFRPECKTLSTTTQRCTVEVLEPYWYDTPTGHTDWRHHVARMKQQSRSQDGPRGQTIQCEAAVGAAFSRCFFSDCVVPIHLAVIGSGINAFAEVSGGDLWNAGHAHGNMCNVAQASTSPGGCNQPATYGCLSGFTNVNGTCVRSQDFMTQCARFGDYDFDSCACTGGCGNLCSPIVVDVLGDGFKMTNTSTGVFFDIEGKGVPEKFSWTAAYSDDAWLAMDRNNNGLIDSGKELFGNVTPQDIHPEGVERNGFLALALYDSAAYGGNGDGAITAQDTVFNRLKIWRDDNHNGVSESYELFTLADLGLEKIDLDYRSSKRTDEHGNEFRYRSKVNDSTDSNIARWAWDVFLVKQP